MKKFIPAFVAPFVLPAALSAQVLMLDFGPNLTTTPSNSPYHTVNTGFTGTSWNKVETADVASGLVYSDGTTATGVTVNVGASLNTSTLTTINLAETPSGNSQLATGTGIYAAGSVGTDGIFEKSNSTGTNVGSVGVQITGLAAGTYTLYLTGRNNSITNFGSTGQVITAYAAAGTAGSDYAFGGYSSGSNTFTGSTTSSSWVAGTNYIELSVSITAGEAINIAVIGGGDAGGSTIDQRGFLNSLQIVNVTSSVPEPSAYSVVMGLGAVGIVSLFRRRPGR